MQVYGDAFHVDPGRCFRIVYEPVTTRPTHCPEAVVTRGWWQDRIGRWWAVDACLERQVAGEAWTDTGFVFVDELGHPYRPELISRTFTRLAKAGGLRPIRLHDLRHTAASLMLASGESPKVVAEILGHSSPVITQVVYQHLMPGQTEAAGERLTGLLAGA